jgi:hypothetical protein
MPATARYAVAVSFDNGTWPLATALLLASMAAVLSLVGVVLGLFSALTGKDPLPKRIRRLLRRAPASAEDFRARGMCLALGGVGVMLMVLNIVSNVVGMVNVGFVGYMPASSLELPNAAVFLITMAAALAAIACFIGSYTLSTRVRYVSSRGSTSSLPGLPPA